MDRTRSSLTQLNLNHCHDIYPRIIKLKMGETQRQEAVLNWFSIADMAPVVPSWSFAETVPFCVTGIRWDFQRPRLLICLETNPGPWQFTGKGLRIGRLCLAYSKKSLWNPRG